MREAPRYLIPNATLLLRVLHSRNNTRKHLERTYAGDANKVAISDALCDIYGSALSDSSEFYGGLVDLESAGRYEERLSELEALWEITLLGFHKWFIIYQSVDIREHIICAVRQPIGMENVLPQNNPSETQNSMKKKVFPKTERKMVILKDLVLGVQQQSEEEYRDIAELLLGRGNFKALPGAPLPKPSVDMLKDQVKRHNAYKFLFGFIPDPDPLQDMIGLGGQSSLPSQLEFPIKFAESELSTSFRGVWNSAVDIMRCHSIVPDTEGPSNSVGYVIHDKKSRSSQGVTWTSSTKLADCGCNGFKKQEICSHSLVVSHLVDDLRAYLDGFNSREVGFLKVVKPTEKGGGNKPHTIKRWGEGKRTAGETSREGKTERKRQKTESVASRDLTKRVPASQPNFPAANRKSSCAKAIKMDPWLETTSPFRLESCAPEYLDCKCYGCNQKLCADSVSSMVLLRNEPHYMRGSFASERSFTPPRPTTYHMSLRCIRKRHGDFV